MVTGFFSFSTERNESVKIFFIPHEFQKGRVFFNLFVIGGQLAYNIIFRHTTVILCMTQWRPREVLPQKEQVEWFLLVTS